MAKRKLGEVEEPEEVEEEEEVEETPPPRQTQNKPDPVLRTLSRISKKLDEILAPTRGTVAPQPQPEQPGESAPPPDDHEEDPAKPQNFLSRRVRFW